jgi:hypothetical protein
VVDDILEDLVNVHLIISLFVNASASATYKAMPIAKFPHH